MKTPKPAEASKTATIRDVARAAGVTAATVSRTLSGKRYGTPPVRDAVFRAVEELGYQPNPHAQRLAVGRAEKHIDLLSLHLDFGMDARKAQLIQGLLLARGFNAPLHAYGWGANEAGAERELVSFLSRGRPRAIVCDLSGLSAESIEELRRFGEDGGIVVCFGYGYGQRPIKLACDQVLFDSRYSQQLAVRHLVGLGHTKLGVCFPTRGRTGSERSTHFVEELRACGLEARDEWVFQGAQREAETEYEEAGEQMARWFLALPERPTALVITNDYAALRFVNELHRAGLSVPQDVSVIGHDDRPLGRSAWVPLSSITHPADEIARHTVDLLDERLNGSTDPPRHIVVQGELKARQSSAAPHAK